MIYIKGLTLIPIIKIIKFICDFKENKPKLNVCLYKDGREDAPIIPNLYFQHSSA